jgi:hypothetical protein
LVAQTGNGEVILTDRRVGFFGTGLPAGWSGAGWDASGSATVAGGLLTLNNAWARRDAMYGAERSLEFVGSFGPDEFQHSGFAQNFNCGEPWAIFSTMGTNNQLFARTTASGCGDDVNTLIPGSWIGVPHRYRIDWNAANVEYFIDGTLVASHAIPIGLPMQMLAASDFDSDGANGAILSIDWERLSPYAASGTFESRVFDAGGPVDYTPRVVEHDAGRHGHHDGSAQRHTNPPSGPWTPVAVSGGSISGVAPMHQCARR